MLKNKDIFTFADVFSGCGGLSLGLISAGWQGCFAIEKNTNAFETLRTNLVDGPRGDSNWPKWLPQEAISWRPRAKNRWELLISA